MIGTYFDGRLGNQFFRYAFARMLKEKRGNIDNFIFNFNSVNNGNKDNGFEDVLKYFNVENYTITTKNLAYTISNKFCFLLYLLRRLTGKYLFSNSYWIRILERNGYILSREDETDLHISIPHTKNIVSEGKFEVPEYIKDIRHILLKEFTPKYDILDKNKKLYEIIDNTNSVCVTIRRGDYLNNQNINNFFCCDIEYLQKAIKKIEELVSNPTFIFFSDDINWVRENISIDHKCYYEDGNDPIWEKLRLMYSCKHFIISNSTFSWWAQYLSRNEEKIVVSPNVWFNNPQWKSYLIEDNFIKIPIR